MLFVEHMNKNNIKLQPNWEIRNKLELTKYKFETWFHKNNRGYKATITKPRLTPDIRQA